MEEAWIKKNTTISFSGGFNSLLPADTSLGGTYTLSVEISLIEDPMLIHFDNHLSLSVATNPGLVPLFFSVETVLPSVLNSKRHPGATNATGNYTWNVTALHRHCWLGTFTAPLMLATRSWNWADEPYCHIAHFSLRTKRERCCIAPLEEAVTGMLSSRYTITSVTWVRPQKPEVVIPPCRAYIVQRLNLSHQEWYHSAQVLYSERAVITWLLAALMPYHVCRSIRA